MKDSDTGIEKETIPFYNSYEKTKTKHLEIKYF